MAQVPRSVRFLQKADAALLSAIEVYNRPTFAYREETFAILALNAWELLLKAKLLAEHSNKPRCLYTFESAHLTKAGKQSMKLYLKRNRSGAALTHSLWKTLTELENKTPVRVDGRIQKNLEALIEIRDNAVHFVLASPQLAKQVLEVGNSSRSEFCRTGTTLVSTRSLRSSLLSHADRFCRCAGCGDSVGRLEGRVKANWLSRATRKCWRPRSCKSVQRHARSEPVVQRSTAAGALAVAITNDPTAPQLTLTEDDFKKIYKWTYKQLVDHLKKRYTDFKMNTKFSGIKKPLMIDPNT